ncbi:MAG: phosphoribosylformylglycinamidine cyclo-ligase [Euryarchaeota archaeon]|nr:phosphoribosylformylglycinamidine cyclo-ligase [Euryarchaeota archaeon]
MTYARAGVDMDLESLAIKALASSLKGCLRNRDGRPGEVMAKIGHFSSLIRVGDDLALALGADGVGTKIILAHQMGKYDTIGIDLIAMNANDIICIGAEPLALLDYLAVERPDPEVTAEIGRGLARGAEMAGITIPGGELATVPEVVRGMDLAGVIVGMLRPSEAITGEDIRPGHAVVGLESSGVHCNGLTLARKVLLGEYDIDEKVFGERSVGEELLEPTRIYVKEVLDVIKNVEVKGLANITGGGLGNLDRLTGYGFEIDSLPEPQEVFTEIQRLGNVPEKEMYRTFNMGVGFCIVVDEKDVQRVIDICESHRTRAFRLGKVVDEKGVKLKEKGFVLNY